MNLLGAASGLIQAPNPNQRIVYQSSSGYAAPSKSNAFVKTPKYQTATAFTGSIAAAVTNTSPPILTVTAITQGQLAANQSVQTTPPVNIVKQLTGTAGGIGTYLLAGNPPTLGSGALTSLDTFMGQVQALGYKDLQQVDGLNLNGTRRKIYLFGVSSGVVRSLQKGGDLLTDGNGDVWLVAMVLEQWQHGEGWASVAVTLQDGS